MRYVTASVVTDTHTHSQNDYRNPCACAPRVNDWHISPIQQSKTTYHNSIKVFSIRWWTWLSSGISHAFKHSKLVRNCRVYLRPLLLWHLWGKITSTHKNNNNNNKKQNRSGVFFSNSLYVLKQSIKVSIKPSGILWRGKSCTTFWSYFHVHIVYLSWDISS